MVGRVGFLQGANKNNYQKKKIVIKGLTVCCTDEYICDRDERNLPPRPHLHVWSRHDVGQIALKAEMKFVPENLILTFGVMG